MSDVWKKSVMAVYAQAAAKSPETLNICLSGNQLNSLVCHAVGNDAADPIITKFIFWGFVRHVGDAKNDDKDSVIDVDKDLYQLTPKFFIEAGKFGTFYETVSGAPNSWRKAAPELREYFIRSWYGRNGEYYSENIKGWISRVISRDEAEVLFSWLLEARLIRRCEKKSYALYGVSQKFFLEFGRLQAV